MLREPESGASARRPRGAGRLPEWARRRLGFRAPGDPVPEDPSQDRALIARAMMFLFLGGATVSVIWLLLPHAHQTRDPGVLVMTIGAYAVGFVLLVGFDRLPMAFLKGAVTMATLVITGAILANHENGSAYVLFYSWATVYAFSFFSLRQATFQVALVGLAFGVVLVVQRDIWQEEPARWLLTVSTLFASGLLVRFLAGTLRYRSLHDPLTGLPNRRLYLQRLDEALQRSASDARSGLVAVVFLDLDGFKYVNDSLGHHAGDLLLADVARRLTGAVRGADLTARFGGDEFALLCTDVAGEEEALAIARRVNEVLAPPVPVGTAEFHVSASVGIAVAARGSRGGEALLRDADAAMYSAKERGRARCELFDERLRNRITDRARLEHDLRPALDRGELEVHYQPLVTLGGEEIVGVEALLRWRHPTRGVLGPAEFLAAAEETGLIVPMGAFVIDRACAQLAAWDAHGGALAGIGMSVNLSARQLPHAHLVDAVDRSLSSHAVDPRRLTLELTEAMLMEEGVAPGASIAALRDLGVRVALDDFGTGYSSLAYLQRFPLDELKLDRTFVAGLGEGGREDAIAGAVVTMAAALGIRVVAEGVEHELQRQALLRLGCAVGQGYLFARPATAPELLAAAQGRRPDLRLAS